MEKTKLININATSTKRLWGFTVDIFFSNFFRMLFVQTFIFSSKKIDEYRHFMSNFKNLFGNDIGFFELKDYHIRYFAESGVFKYFINFLFIVFFTGALYNFLCYAFLGSTFGQRLLSLKLFNIKDDKKPNILKVFLKAILVPLPFVTVFALSSFTVLYLINFHLYVPTKGNKISYIITKIVAISNPFTAILAAVFFILFWYGFYYLNTKRLILSDVISGTRVVDIKKKNSIDLLMNEKKDFSEKKDFVYVLDKTLDNIEKFNRFLKSVLDRWIEIIKNNIGKKK